MAQAWAPGRVNLIGDHTDHTGGLVLPMAIDLGTTVTGDAGGDHVALRSATEREPAVIPLGVADPAAMTPSWARYVAGVVAELHPAVGFTGEVTTTLPVGGGLSSSAALEVAVAVALGFDGDVVTLAQLCQRAEQRASGVPCGIMDQLTSVAGVEGHALRIDCTTLEVRPVPLPDDLEVVVVDSGQPRDLATSPYAERAAACAAAQAQIGPLAEASLADIERIDDDTVRRRARHVVTENHRVDEFAVALKAGDRGALREVLAGSHASLRDDFDVSTATLDALVDALVSMDGVIGARLTGAGFGGCLVALVERGTTVSLPNRMWRVVASRGAHLRVPS
ncbi:MAG: galactokinase family protein [Acidimicrobiales bacterium]